MEAATKEFGDLLFTMMNIARFLKIDPESALRQTNAKFRSRFRIMERLAGDTERLKAMSVTEQEALWSQAKQQEKQV
jgi:uncharacterized protein YabN with tetrapyrrole methylase and pyrophosphatase domain